MRTETNLFLKTGSPPDFVYVKKETMDSLMRTVRRLKAKHWCALLVLAMLAFEYFGLFRRMQEKSYAQLSYPVDGDVMK